jgi:hypothetical protein
MEGCRKQEKARKQSVSTNLLNRRFDKNEQKVTQNLSAKRIREAKVSKDNDGLNLTFYTLKSREVSQDLNGTIAVKNEKVQNMLKDKHDA